MKAAAASRAVIGDIFIQIPRLIGERARSLGAWILIPLSGCAGCVVLLLLCTLRCAAPQAKAASAR